MEGPQLQFKMDFEMWKFPVCVYVEVLRVLLELQFELGNVDLCFCYNFW